jgi:hypothetical protein
VGRAFRAAPRGIDLADQRVEKRKYLMSIRKRKAIRKTVPLLGAAATAGLFSLMGTAMAGDFSAQPVSQIVLSDDAEVTLAAWHHGHSHSIPARTRRALGKGAGAV